MQLNAYLFDIRVSPPLSPLIRFFLDERHLAYITLERRDKKDIFVGILRYDIVRQML